MRGEGFRPCEPLGVCAGRARARHDRPGGPSYRRVHLGRSGFSRQWNMLRVALPIRQSIAERSAGESRSQKVGSPMRKQYRSALMASVHETAEGLHAAGVMDKRTMRDFDELRLTPVRPLKPKEIRAIRLREGASQAVFARYLNVTMGLVSQWERGEKRPQGASLKLLASRQGRTSRLSSNSACSKA